MTRLAAALAAVLIGVAAASADGSAGLEPGTRIRLHYRESAKAELVALTGNLKSADQTQVTVVGSDAPGVTVPVDSIVKVETSRGHHRHLRTGAIAGAAFGLAGGGVCLAAGCGGNGATLLRATVAWASIGGLVGLLIQGESWQDVPTTEVRVGVTPIVGQRIIAMTAIVSWR